MSGGIVYDSEEELETMVFSKIESIDQIIKDPTDASGEKIIFTAKTFEFGNDQSETVKGYRF